MAVLLSGIRVVVGGVTSSDTLTIPTGLKVAGREQWVLASVDGTVFPIGTTKLTVGISTDGGATFKTASGNATGPIGGNWTIGYSLGPDDVPTHAIFQIDAPLGFSALVNVVTLE